MSYNTLYTHYMYTIYITHIIYIKCYYTTHTDCHRLFIVHSYLLYTHVYNVVLLLISVLYYTLIFITGELRGCVHWLSSNAVSTKHSLTIKSIGNWYIHIRWVYCNYRFQWHCFILFINSIISCTVYVCIVLSSMTCIFVW